LTVYDREKQQAKKVAIDWRDNPDIVSLDKLAEADVYYKRNFVPDLTLPACPTDQVNKLRPLGIFYSVRTWRERPLWVRMLGAWWRDEHIAFLSRGVWRSLRNYLYQVRRPLQTPEERFFRAVRPGEGELKIFFQTKAYDPAGSPFPDDNIELNEERAAIIRALRQEFGEHAIAGFVSWDYMLRNYPDLVVSWKTEQNNYINMVKKYQIGVSTRGLRNAPPFVLAEFLAAGRCILSKPIKAVFPKPLVHGEHLLFFYSIEELLEQCRMVLRDADLRRRLSHGAATYYQQEVEPKVRIKKILEGE
jgi:hypothetical protein